MFLKFTDKKVKKRQCLLNCVKLSSRIISHELVLLDNDKRIDYKIEFDE